MSFNYESNYKKSIDQITVLNKQIQLLYSIKSNIELNKSNLNLYWRADECKDINILFDNINSRINCIISSINSLNNTINTISSKVRQSEYQSYKEYQEYLERIQQN